MLTHCNAGVAGACVGYGTALGVVRAAHEAGRRPTVWVDETRPVLQGARLTAWELDRLGIPHTVVADVAAGSLMADGEVDCVIVGADRIAANGDVANKVGTYALAVLAHHHGIPFYVAAPTSTIDPTCPTAPHPHRAARPDEVRSPAPASPQAPIDNPAFDITPATSSPPHHRSGDRREADRSLMRHAGAHRRLIGAVTVRARRYPARRC